MNARQVVERTLRRESSSREKTKRALRVTGIVVLAVGAAAALGALVIRDQYSRHQRNLFSPHPLRRLAALGYLSRREASVDTIRLLRDYIGWERKPMLRRRAEQVLARVEKQIAAVPAEPREAHG